MEIWTTGLPVSVALSVVAAIGYLVGRRRPPKPEATTIPPSRELHRARIAATQLEVIAEQMRKGLAAHHASVQRFGQRLSELSDESPGENRHELRDEAEEMLKPTLRLSVEIADAYNQIRSQTENLMLFTRVRTDPLTGVGNRHELNEALEVMFSAMRQYEIPFSLMIVNVDPIDSASDRPGRTNGDDLLREVAQLINDSVHESGIVTRYGGKEFVVILPDTDLEGAARCGSRIRNSVQKNLSLTISGGGVQAAATDDRSTLLARADKALYAAKASGRNRIFVHDSRQTHTAAADFAASSSSRDHVASLANTQSERKVAQQTSVT